MLHIKSDGVKVLESTADVSCTFLNIKSIVQNNLVTRINGDDNLTYLFYLPLSVELVCFTVVNLPELLLQVRSQVNRGVEIFPDESVVLHVPDKQDLLIKV